MALDADLLIERDQASSRAAAFARLPPLETNTTGRARSAPPPQTRHQPVWLENGDIDVDDDEPDCIPDYALGPDGKPIKPFGSPKGAPKRSPEDEDRIRRHFGQSKHADGGESGAADGTGDGGDADGHGNDEGAEQGGDDAPAGDEGNGNDDDTTEARPEQGDEIPDSGNDDKGQGGGIGSGDDKKKDDGTSQTGGDIGSASGKPVPIKGIQASRWAV